MSFLFSTFCNRKTAKCSNHFKAYMKSIFLKTGSSSLRLNYRHMSQVLHESAVEEKERFIPFMEVLNERREQAKRSILVQVQSAQSFKELHTYCSSLGTVKKMLHYQTGVEPMHFIIVEFSNEAEVKNILNHSCHIEDSQAVPVRSHFLWFKAAGKKFAKLKQTKTSNLNVENGTRIISDEDMKTTLRGCENICEQMNKLYELSKLNDVGSRLRFLVAGQIEDAVSGLFPNAVAYPFGSSVNGCGKMGCDLDLVLRLTHNQVVPESRLVFHCKAASGSERTISQKHMEAVGDLIQLFLPGCAQVRRILQARVPIIKYYQQLTDIECDLSMSNMSGVYMSDYLYIMGSLDPRVRPLIFTVKKWAQEVGLTSDTPGRWITNFSLTLMVLAFLQEPINNAAILPSLNVLVKQSGSEDKYITEDGINCTFLRDISKLNMQFKNEDNLTALLLQFFVHYSQFDFQTKAICLNEGIAITKPEHSALYIVNPLERGLNVSKNVSLEELEKFRMESREAAWILESQESKNNNWGILNLFDNKKKNFSSLLSQRPKKLLEVSKLFEEESVDNVEYKNESVKKQVQSIRVETENNLRQLNDKKLDSINKRKSKR